MDPSTVCNKTRAKYFLLILSIAMVKGNITSTTENAWNNEIFAVPDLRGICEHFKDVGKVNKTCADQLDVVCGNLTLLLTMLEASSKFPFTGMGYTSKRDFGNFDQCLAINHSYEGGRILGEHCTEGLLVPDNSENKSILDTYYYLSVCRPDGCKADDYNEIVLSLLHPNLPEFFQDDRCQKAQPSKAFDTVEIVTLTIFAVVILLMVISTIYDFYIYQNNLKNIHPLLIAFSILSNGRKLLHISRHSKSKEQIEILNGLRVLSMMWIVAGHGFLTWETIPVFNKGEWGGADNWVKLLYAGYIITAGLAVDTFFYISGFLVSFKYLLQCKDKSLLNQVFTVPEMYIHRYLRLTPALLMIYLVVISLFTRFGSGPLWEDILISARDCKSNWTAVLLYFQNYHNYDDICLSQTWFLCAVMQMFILSPLVLIPLSLTLRKPLGLKKSMIALTILNIFCALMHLAHKLYDTNYRNEYDTHSRLTDYLMGMALGVFMRETLNKPFLYMFKEHQRHIINIVIWTLTIAGMFLTFICVQVVEVYDKYQLSIISYSVLRPAWCFGLTWLIYSSHHGYGGLINWILCRPIFQVIGRLTYCIYLVHQTIIDYKVAITRVPWYFTDYNAFYLFCGHYSVSLIAATFWTLSFESPLIVLAKYLGEIYESLLMRIPILGKSASLQSESNESSQLNIISETTENASSKCMDCEGLYRKSNELS